MLRDYRALRVLRNYLLMLMQYGGPCRFVKAKRKGLSDDEASAKIAAGMKGLHTRRELQRGNKVVRCDLANAPCGRPTVF